MGIEGHDEKEGGKRRGRFYERARSFSVVVERLSRSSLYLPSGQIDSRSMEFIRPRSPSCLHWPIRFFLMIMKFRRDHCETKDWPCVSYFLNLYRLIYCKLISNLNIVFSHSGRELKLHWNWYFSHWRNTENSHWTVVRLLLIVRSSWM